MRLALLISIFALSLLPKAILADGITAEELRQVLTTTDNETICREFSLYLRTFTQCDLRYPECGFVSWDACATSDRTSWALELSNPQYTVNTKPLPTRPPRSSWRVRDDGNIEWTRNSCEYLILSPTFHRRLNACMGQVFSPAGDLLSRTDDPTVVISELSRPRTTPFATERWCWHLLSTGRGFSRVITDLVITSQTESEIIATARGDLIGYTDGTWSLVIDVSRQFLVKRAVFGLTNNSGEIARLEMQGVADPECPIVIAKTCSVFEHASSSPSWVLTFNRLASQPDSSVLTRVTARLSDPLKGPAMYETENSITVLK